MKRAILQSRILSSQALEFVNGLLGLGRWLRAHPAKLHFNTRYQLYGHVAGLLQGEPFDLLEAEVMSGDSIREWVRLSPHPESRFFGFDTFTGLPEAWQTGLMRFEAGTFSNQGRVPQVNDGRVTFMAGLFQDMLPGFLESYRRQKHLVVHCDAALYTSTL